MIIPENIVNSVAENNTDRVIFLVMSTLPDNDKAQIETYKYNDEKDFVFKGISQLEPGTKYYLQKLARENKTVDRIIIIASEESRKENEKYDNTSAIDVYKTRIKEFMTSGRSSQSFGRSDKNPDISESEFAGKKLYDSETFFEKNVHIIEESGMQRLWEASDAILGVRDHTELYIDMQGGNRNDIPLFNTILELMGDRNVNVAERVATINYDFRKQRQEIQTVDDLYDSYDLVTAYQIFKRYGWGNQLSEYFKGSEADSIAEAVQSIAEAIKLCDVEGFDDGLEALQKSIVAWKSDGNSSEKSEMDFLIDLIREDYGELLDDIKYKRKCLKYVHQIRWCLKKSFIQQALTIFESKMPKEFVWNAICYYCDTGDDKEDILGKFDIIFTEHLKAHENEGYKFSDINHFWIRDYYREPKGVRIIKKKYGGEDAKSLMQDFNKLCQDRNLINHAAEKQLKPGGFADRHKDALPNGRETFNINKLVEFLTEFETCAGKIDKLKKESVVDLA